MGVEIIASLRIINVRSAILTMTQLSLRVSTWKALARHPVGKICFNHLFYYIFNFEILYVLNYSYISRQCDESYLKFLIHNFNN